MSDSGGSSGARFGLTRETGFLFAAIFLALAFSAYGYTSFWKYQRDHASERQCAAASYQEQSSGERKPECLRVASAKPSEKSADAADPPSRDSTAYYDLKAQQDVAEWTYVVMISGLLGLAATVVGTVFVYWNLQAVREDIRQSKVANRIQLQSLLILSTHPTLTFPENDIENPLVFFELKNAGVAAAEKIDVGVRLKLFLREKEREVFQVIDFDELVASGALGDTLAGEKVSWLCRPKASVRQEIMEALKSSTDAPLKTGGSPVGAELELTFAYESFGERQYRRLDCTGDARLHRKDLGGETRLHPKSVVKKLQLVEK